MKCAETDLTGMVVSNLKDLIVSGRLPVGSRLPSERELSKKLKVSRITIRRGVKALEESGILKSKIGSGTYVMDKDAKNRNKIISFMSGADSITIAKIQDAALEKGYLLSIYSQCRSEWNPKMERIYMEAVKNGRHTALLAFCSPIEPNNDDMLEELEQSGVRVIHIDHHSSNLPKQSYILPDLKKAGHMAAMRLIMGGYSTIVILGKNYPQMQLPYGIMIEAGIREAIEEHGDSNYKIIYKNPCLVNGNSDKKELADYFSDIPRNSGFISLSLRYCKDFLNTISGAGIKIPEDYGFIGIRLSGDTGENPDYDFIDFNYTFMYEKALELALSHDWQGVKELVKPKIKIKGTAKGNNGGII